MHLRFNYILILKVKGTKMTLPKEHLEDEIWSLIRMSPEKLPLGDLKCCPLFSICA
jgi:hypothetical protein